MGVPTEAWLRNWKVIASHVRAPVKELVDARAQAKGQTKSEWLRDAVMEKLKREEPVA